MISQEQEEESLGTPGQFDTMITPATTETRPGHFFSYNPEKEPIKAYLRIRPRPEDSEFIEEDPYLKIVDEYEISMTPPSTSNAYRTRNRAPERYRFSKIFTDQINQQDFFKRTTLPLVDDVLRGQNGLIFAYGVTNSGKTFSIMGTKEQPGLLPRALDVLFNSTQGFLSDSKLKPCMHSLVRAYDDDMDENRQVLAQLGNKRMEVHSGFLNANPDLWETYEHPIQPHEKLSIPIDQNFEYAIWISFAEIYTEKIYDLLVSPPSSIHRNEKRKALSLKYEYSSGNKFISGLKEVKVKSLEEAYAILSEGQRNRAVYSTITNHKSSRSHSIFTIKVVRTPIDENNYVIEDAMYATVSKLSVVDLAGSERHCNTLNSGQRLKEAGNINKSLMVLGQCMETLRLNQLKADIGKKQTVVPYRHSKLTELFKSSFEGDGKAVMVVNINPFDTGFDENSHVMKFAAVAKDVATWRRVHPKLELKNVSTSVKRQRVTVNNTTAHHHIKAGFSDMSYEEETSYSNETNASGKRYKAETESDLSEESEEEEDEEEDPFVDNLITQVDYLYNKWLESEARTATMESEIRQQVAKETEVQLKRMEEIYLSSLKRENDVTKAQIEENLTSSNNNNDDEGFLARLHDRQKAMTIEMDVLRTRLKDYEVTKQSLLEKITELEKDKQKQQDTIRTLIIERKEKDELINKLREGGERDDIDKSTSSFMETEMVPQQQQQQQQQDNTFNQFLELRKKLRRCIFKNKTYPPTETNATLKEIENFKGVTFKLVKETGMGKVMKMIAQKDFNEDAMHVKKRSIKLLKHYAKLSLPILAPSSKGRESLVVLSVTAGREEELITEMRNALSTLQDENGKLKHRLKQILQGHRRLEHAFEKTREIDSSNLRLSDHSIDLKLPESVSDKVMVEKDEEKWPGRERLSVHESVETKVPRNDDDDNDRKEWSETVKPSNNNDNANNDDDDDEEEQMELFSPILGASTSFMTHQDEEEDDYYSLNSSTPSSPAPIHKRKRESSSFK